MLKMDDSFAAGLTMVLDDTSLDGYDVDDDDKLRSRVGKRRGGSMDLRSKASTDQESDCSLTSTADCFVPAVDALLGQQAIVDQLSTGIDDDPASLDSTGKTNDAAHDVSYSS